MSNTRYPFVSELDHEDCCDEDILIEVKDLSLFYGEIAAFQNISLNINKGCVSGIVGPSGCGKSSFIHCLNRMIESIPEAKSSGDILFNGKSIFDSRLNLSMLRRKIGTVFQEPTPLPLSIESNIALPLKEHGFDNIKERVEKALKDVGLFSEVKDKLKTPAANLSGGQKQRLCLARTLALEPEVILMDEPCSALDPISTQIIEELIEKLKGKYTIVIITHNLAQARRVCDYISVFWCHDKGGELIETNSCLNVFEHPKSNITKDYVGGLRG